MAKAKVKAKTLAKSKAPVAKKTTKAALSSKAVQATKTARAALAVGNEVKLLTGLFKGTKGVVTKLGKAVQVQVKFAGEHTSISLGEGDLQRV